MKKISLLLFSAVVLLCSDFAVVTAQSFDNPQNSAQRQPSSRIKSIQTLGEKFGIAYTDDRLFKTNDNGDSWQTMALPKDFSQIIGAADFLDENTGWAILVDSQSVVLELAKTSDGGNFWTLQPLHLPIEDLREAELENIALKFSDRAHAVLTLPLASSSNFSRRAVYATADGGKNWRVQARLMNKKEQDAENAFDRKSLRATLPTDESVLAAKLRTNSSWLLAASGECVNFKSDCAQTTKIYMVSENLLLDITPSEIKELNRIEKENIKSRTENPLLVVPPPGGSTRISMNRGFDKCTAAPVDQMLTWWNASPFYDVNIYMSGRNRSCSQTLLTAAWVSQVSGMGWGLIPTVVGYQAPCSVCTTCQKHSSDPATAETQGRGEADIAISAAVNLGLTRGSVLYYDMERYDDLSGTGACSTPVKSFLKGWTDRLKEQGYISGVYGSPTNAAADWINIPAASQMGVVWLARWNNIASVFGVAPLADNYWANHQRIHQYLGGHNETWGGVTFNIDSDIEDAPVAGAALPKLRIFDFDGDGKSDMSVFRPADGSWYQMRTTDGFYGERFGAPEDKPVPADYDGDGKTDIAVYRAGAWYLQRSTAGFYGINFGSPEDIPQPFDFDGDGKADIAVYRPSLGSWYIYNITTGQFTGYKFGAAEDKPVAADYDGDGRADIAVFRPSEAAWYFQRSKLGFGGMYFGVGTDKPIPADYDGDGKADIAVYRPSNGSWYLQTSSEGFKGYLWGAPGDLPVPADYDGDGRTDIGVYRPAEGAWYLQKTRDGFQGAVFGATTDKPIPNSFVP